MKNILYILGVIILLTSCQKEEQYIEVIHKRGKHHAEAKGKNATRKKLSSIGVKFTNDSKYKHEHQSSWNKITGSGIPLFLNLNGAWVRIEEYILVWRYTPDCDCFEVGEYQRQRGQMIFPPEVTRMKVNEEREFSLSFVHWSLNHLPIGAYFGGRIAAPNDVKYFVIPKR
jgi:hypothetical protein